jgi:hypothetical protein
MENKVIWIKGKVIMKTMRIVILTVLMFVLMACSSKSILEQSEITVKSNSRVSIVAKSGADTYRWREISGIEVKIVDPYSQRLEFVAPDVSKKEMLVFELEAHFGDTVRTAKATVMVVPSKKGDGVDDNNNATNTNIQAPHTLTLTIPKTTLNKETNTTIKLTATYDDNTTKDVTDQAEWIIDRPEALTIKNHTLIAKKDTNLTIQAKVGNTLSNKVNLTIYWEVNGYRLPPEPDPKVNNATLLGVDGNNNGVRDDVERWIYNEYKDKHPIHIDIGMQAARGYRLVLEKQPKTKNEAMSIMKEVDSVAYCELYYWLDADEFGDPLLIKNIITDKYFRYKVYFNTKERLDIYDRYDSLFSGDSYVLLPAKEEKATCDFNTSKYDKE